MNEQLAVRPCDAADAGTADDKRTDVYGRLSLDAPLGSQCIACACARWPGETADDHRWRIKLRRPQWLPCMPGRVHHHSLPGKDAKTPVLNRKPASCYSARLGDHDP